MISPKYQKDMFRGVCGEFALAICGDKFLGGDRQPISEASPAAVLFQTMTAFGAYVGRGAFDVIDSTKHYPTIYTLIVGKTSKARKGSSLNHVRRLLESIDPEWAQSNIVGGLSSGEGLITVFTEQTTSDPNSRVEKKDCRYLITASEFVRILVVGRREGNTITQNLREGWDGLPLQIMTKTNPMCIKNYHYGLIGHITLPEFKMTLKTVDITNGFLNRFLTVFAEKNGSIANPKGLNDEQIEYFRKVFTIAISKARQAGQVEMTENASLVWDAIYKNVSESEESDFYLDSALSRGEAHIRRLAMMYALTDGRRCVTEEDFASAFHCWSYCCESAKLIFSNAENDWSDAVVKYLSEVGTCQKGDLYRMSNGNIPKDRLDRILNSLQAKGQIEFRKEYTDGRPKEFVILKSFTGSFSSEKKELTN